MDGLERRRLAARVVHFVHFPQLDAASAQRGLDGGHFARRRPLSVARGHDGPHVALPRALRRAGVVEERPLQPVGGAGDAPDLSAGDAAVGECERQRAGLSVAHAAALVIARAPHLAPVVCVHAKDGLVPQRVARLAAVKDLVLARELVVRGVLAGDDAPRVRRGCALGAPTLRAAAQSGRRGGVGGRAVPALVDLPCRLVGERLAAPRGDGVHRRQLLDGGLVVEAVVLLHYAQRKLCEERRLVAPQAHVRAHLVVDAALVQAVERLLARLVPHAVEDRLAALGCHAHEAIQADRVGGGDRLEPLAERPRREQQQSELQVERRAALVEATDFAQQRRVLGGARPR
mmetsp:Transcript_9988/g.31294  ORF Transcript_9988/g.31294 Transcript_9988/m.31294 type:complete len:346 (+) Transcript_9988:147-1184(+)